jgi:stage V sporulation protein AD
LGTRKGRYTIMMDTPPSVVGVGTVGCSKEAQGPMAPYIDLLGEDAYFGQKSWEKAESQMQKTAVDLALKDCSLSYTQIDTLFAGDLLNQCIGSHYGLRETNIPFLGLYGACSTMAEGLALAAVFVDGGMANHAMAVTSSHFCSAERQFRFPLEYASLRAPTAQWTVTGSGAAVVSSHSSLPYIKAVSFGSIIDKGVTDINNMGAAMAPAAAQTLQRFFKDTLTGPDNYDLILTGDLGAVGSELLHQLMEREHYHLRKKHSDCGLMIYDTETQKVNAGASGAGCCATVLCSYIIKSMRAGKLNNVVLIATGALMSTLSIQQGESIPAVAHLVHLSTSPH